VKFFRNLAGVLLTSAVIAPVGFVTSVVLTRYLGLDDRGHYAIAQNFATLATMLFQFGWPTASIYRLRSARSSPAEVSGAALMFLGGVSIVVVAGSIALEPLLRDGMLGGLPTAIFVLAVVTIPFRVLANGFGAVARGIDRFRYENWYAFLLQVGNLAAVGLALVWWQGGLYELMVWLAVVYVATSAGLIARVWMDTSLSLALQPREMSRSFRFGLKTYAMTVSSRIHERADLFMLAALMSDATQVAFFAVAKGGIQILRLLPNALGKVAFPHVAGLAARDAADFSCALVRQSLIFMLPASLALAAAAPWLLPFVYGEPYAASTLPFLLMLPGVVLAGSERVISRYFTGTNQHKPNVVTRFVSLGLNLLLNWLWIPKYGIVGAAAAGLVSYAVDALMILAVFLMMTDKRVADLVVPQRSDFDPYLRALRRLRPSPDPAP